MLAVLPPLGAHSMSYQVEYLGTIQTILETLRAEGIEVEEIIIEGVEE